MDNKDILEGGALDNIDSRHPESADESQVHGRKMLRRVANRRSAQQSRARKKVNSRAFWAVLNTIIYMRRSANPKDDSSYSYEIRHWWEI